MLTLLSSLPIFLLLLLSHTHAAIGINHVNCLPPPGPLVPLGDCLDAIMRIPPATLLHDDFLHPFTFRAGHCAIAVARDPVGTTVHPPHDVVGAMLNIVWPDIRYIAQDIVRQCVREGSGKAGICLGNSFIEGVWYGYSVKVKYSAAPPPQRLLGGSLSMLERPGSPTRPSSPGLGTRPSSPGSPKGAPKGIPDGILHTGGGGEERHRFLVRG